MLETYDIPQKWRDIASRAGWTLAQAIVSGITVTAFDLPVQLIPVFAAGLSALKSYIATKVGNRATVTFVEPVEPVEPAHRMGLTSHQTGQVGASRPRGGTVPGEGRRPYRDHRRDGGPLA